MLMTDFHISPDAHHYLSIEMNQQVWKLLGQDQRDDQENRRLEHFALASMFHWHHSPKFQPLNAQRGHWLLSRVYAVLDRGQEALRQATQCLNLTKELDLKDFDRAYAHEAMARAHAAVGDADNAATHYGHALQAGEAIAGEEDRKLFVDDLTGPPWFGVDF